MPRQPVSAARGDETHNRPEDRAEDQSASKERDRVHRFHMPSIAPGAERLVAPHVKVHRVRQPPGEQAGTDQARAEPEGRSDQN